MGKKSAKTTPAGQDPRKSVSASLPLPVATPPLSSLATKLVPKKKDKNDLPRNGLVKKKALAILALRMDGWSNDEIAAELQIKPKSVNQYIYLAGRNGWIARHDGSVIGDPKDDVELNILPRVLRNLREFLDSDDDEVRKEVTLKTAEGTLHKRFASDAASAPTMNALTINIVTPPGAAGIIREGTTHGTPMFTEGQVLDVKALDVGTRPQPSDKPNT